MVTPCASLPGQTRHCRCRYLQKHFPSLHLHFQSLQHCHPTATHSQGTEFCPASTDGWVWDWSVPLASLQLVCKCCLSWQLLHKVPATACLIVFPLSPPQKHQDPAQPLSCYWTGNSTDPANRVPWGKQERTEVTFFCMQNTPSVPPASASGCLCSTGLCILLWGTADAHAQDQSWVFTQQCWPARCDHAAEACSGWSVLPWIAFTLREEKMPLTWTVLLFSSLSSCHYLPTSCTCHLLLAIMQLNSAQSDFQFSPFKLCFCK